MEPMSFSVIPSTAINEENIQKEMALSDRNWEYVNISSFLPSSFYPTHSAINYAQAVFAGVILWKYLNPNSYLGYVGATIASMAIANFSYLTVKKVLNIHLKYSHRLSGPILLSNKSYEYEKVFAAAFLKIKQHRAYSLFEGFHCNRNEQDARTFFKEMLSHGVCLGSVIALLQAMEKDPTSSSCEILKLVKIKKIYCKQLLHIMMAAYQQKEAKVRKRAWMEVAWANFGCTNFKNEYNMLDNKYPEENSANCELVRVGKKLQKEVASLQKDLIPWDELEGCDFSAQEPSFVFQSHVEKLISLLPPSANQTVSGRIVISGDIEDRLEGRMGHCLLFQFHKGLFRFYDSINSLCGGLFEYSNKSEFYQVLKDQILGDFTSLGYKKILVKFCLRNSRTAANPSKDRGQAGS